MLKICLKCKYEVIVDLNIVGVKWRLCYFCFEVFMCVLIG